MQHNFQNLNRHNKASSFFTRVPSLHQKEMGSPILQTRTRQPTGTTRVQCNHHQKDAVKHDKRKIKTDHMVSQKKTDERKKRGERKKKKNKERTTSLASYPHTHSTYSHRASRQHSEDCRPMPSTPPWDPHHHKEKRRQQPTYQLQVTASVKKGLRHRKTTDEEWHVHSSTSLLGDSTVHSLGQCPQISINAGNTNTREVSPPTRL